MTRSRSVDPPAWNASSPRLRRPERRALSAESHSTTTTKSTINNSNDFVNNNNDQDNETATTNDNNSLAYSKSINSKNTDDNNGYSTADGAATILTRDSSVSSSSFHDDSSRLTHSWAKLITAVPIKAAATTTTSTETSTPRSTTTTPTLVSPPLVAVSSNSSFSSATSLSSASTTPSLSQTLRAAMPKRKQNTTTAVAAAVNSNREFHNALQVQQQQQAQSITLPASALQSIAEERRHSRRSRSAEDNKHKKYGKNKYGKNKHKVIKARRRRRRHRSLVPSPRLRRHRHERQQKQLQQQQQLQHQQKQKVQTQNEPNRPVVPPHPTAVQQSETTDVEQGQPVMEPTTTTTTKHDEDQEMEVSVMLQTPPSSPLAPVAVRLQTSPSSPLLAPPRQQQEQGQLPPDSASNNDENTSNGVPTTVTMQHLQSMWDEFSLATSATSAMRQVGAYSFRESSASGPLSARENASVRYTGSGACDHSSLPSYSLRSNNIYYSHHDASSQSWALPPPPPVSTMSATPSRQSQKSKGNQNQDNNSSNNNDDSAVNNRTRRKKSLLEAMFCMGCPRWIILACLGVVAALIFIFLVKGKNNDVAMESIPNIITTPTPTNFQNLETSPPFATPTVAPTTMRPTTVPTPAPITCGCRACTEAMLATPISRNSDETCLARIEREMEESGLTQDEACAHVATRYPLQCGPHCHPDKCDGQGAAHCGCLECVKTLWNMPTREGGKFSCGQVMLLQMGNQNNGKNALQNEYEACQAVSERYPDTCGQGCNPDTCPSNNPERCGCFSCTTDVWNTVTEDGATCGERIEYLQSELGGSLNATWACLQIANNEFPLECGACNPMTCRTYPNEPPPTFCGCPECVPEILDRDANGVSCSNRMAWLQTPIGTSHSELEACRIIAGQDYPAQCSRACNPDTCRGPPKCGCASCTEEALQLSVDGFTCAERIYYLETEAGGSLSEEEACLKVGGRDYPDDCGACDPSRCGLQIT